MSKLVYAPQDALKDYTVIVTRPNHPGRKSDIQVDIRYEEASTPQEAAAFACEREDEQGIPFGVAVLAGRCEVLFTQGFNE